MAHDDRYEFPFHFISKGASHARPVATDEISITELETFLNNAKRIAEMLDFTEQEEGTAALGFLDPAEVRDQVREKAQKLARENGW